MNNSINIHNEDNKKLLFELIKIQHENIIISHDILNHGIILRKKFKNFIYDVHVYHIYLIIFMFITFYIDIYFIHNNNNTLSISLYYFLIYLFTNLLSLLIFNKKNNLNEDINYYLYKEGYIKIINSFDKHTALYNKYKNLDI